MTNTPEAPIPGSVPIASPERAPGATPVEPSAEPVTDAAELDRGTYTRLIEPRSPARLELAHGRWHQISRNYLKVQLIANIAYLAVLVAIVLVVANVLGWTWAYIPGGILAAIEIWTIAILPRQVRAIGYQLRDDDLVFRRGILWQRLVAVPYGRMQLVDITHGPLDRGFGIAQLKLVTAAASTGVVIPGLAQATADALRDHLVHVAESRRTGL